MHHASANQWWRIVPTLAGLEPTLARLALAQAEVQQQPDGPAVRVLCEFGGWRDAQTLLRCYQQPHAGQRRTAVEGRRRIRRCNPDQPESTGGNPARNTFKLIDC